jgi:SecD/SecF fusion protein
VFLAALLTVIGYSINDSVVVFDRVRELRRARSKDPLLEVANDACLETVPRTINTGLGALFILFTLYFLGGETLTDFALALLICIFVGTYSSVFTATPLAVWFEAVRDRRKVEPARRPAAPAAPAPAAPAKERRSDDATAASATTAAPAKRSPKPPVGPAPRPRKQRRKPAKKR